MILLMRPRACCALRRSRGANGRGPGRAVASRDLTPLDRARSNRRGGPSAQPVRANDVLVLAELDLEQRREGDVLGAAQAGGRSSLRLLRVLEHADLIARARELAAECVARDPELTTPGFADAIRATELLASPDWLERN